MERLGVNLKGAVNEQEQIEYGIQTKEILQYVEAELNTAAKNHFFNSLEKVKNNFAIVSNEFAVGEVLTPTMKLQRKKARDFFQKEILAIYQKSDAIINM